MKKGFFMVQVKFVDINYQYCYFYLFEVCLLNFQFFFNDDDDYDDGDGVYLLFGVLLFLLVVSLDGGVGVVMVVCFLGESLRSGDGDEDVGVVVVVFDVVVFFLL